MGKLQDVAEGLPLLLVSLALAILAIKAVLWAVKSFVPAYGETADKTVGFLYRV